MSDTPQEPLAAQVNTEGVRVAEMSSGAADSQDDAQMGDERPVERVDPDSTDAVTGHSGDTGDTGDLADALSNNPDSLLSGDGVNEADVTEPGPTTEASPAEADGSVRGSEATTEAERDGAPSIADAFAANPDEALLTSTDTPDDVGEAAGGNDTQPEVQGESILEQLGRIGAESEKGFAEHALAMSEDKLQKAEDALDGLAPDVDAATKDAAEKDVEYAARDRDTAQARVEAASEAVARYENRNR